MRSSRRKLIAVAAAFTVLLSLGFAPSSAQEAEQQSVVVEVSDDQPRQGETITCTASGLLPDSTYDVLFGSATWSWEIQSVTSGSDGAASADFTIPRESEVEEAVAFLIPEWGILCSFADSEGIIIGGAYMNVQDPAPSEGATPSTTVAGFTG